MADEKVEDYPERLTEPKDDDLVDITIESAPASGIWASQKMKWSLIKALFGNAFTQDIMIVGSGTGIEESNLKVSDIDLDGSMYWSHKDWNTVQGYLAHQGASGAGYFNGRVNCFIGVNGDTYIRIDPNGIRMAEDPDVPVIIGDAGFGTGAKVDIKGKTDDDTAALDIRNLSGTRTFKAQNDGLIYLRFGEGINEFSTDGDMGGNSDTAVPTEKAVKTYVDTAIGNAPSFVPASYAHDVATVAAGIGVGEQRFNNLVYASITEIYVSNLSDNGNDLSDLYNNILKAGDLIYIQQANDVDKSVYLEISGAIVDNVSYFTIPVTFEDSGSGGSILDTEQIGMIFYSEPVSATPIIGGVVLSSSSNTNILNGTYVILADTTAVSSVTSGVGQDSNWTLEITQAGITNKKGVVTFTGNLEKDGGGGQNYDIAIFKNGSIVSESEQIDQKLESGGKGQSVTVMAIIESSTNDTFDIRVAGNGTADDIFCGGGSLYIQ
jgi:hypothetical protein